ncbi:MAG: DedA family protein [Thermoplasmata archaeon]|uniref:DedA family protein n=1 Tax=Candidatus Sysuiplasma superficiale TaxID=2823368 RepID=A0A8J7YYF4_9ARCH|nr:DedA family protein [Candidatus Sysuiplasma superficiale]MBX8644691.1 DedA family protein [Candidatus Sysuiplasma superficiale]MCL4346833.1 DedA family protein [Candidatus Thermoplasmatota archaeon]
MAIISDLFTISLSVLLSLGYLGIFYLMTLDSMMVPVAGEAVMILAGVLAYRGSFSLAAVILVATIASVTGSTFSWLIGKYGGRRVVEKYGPYLLIRRGDIDRADAFFRRHGDSAVFAGRVIPLVRTYISLPAGIALMDFRRFIIFTIAGSLLFISVLTVAGYELGRNMAAVHSILSYLNDLAAAVIALIVLSSILYFIFRRRRSARYRT